MMLKFKYLPLGGIFTHSPNDSVYMKVSEKNALHTRAGINIAFSASKKVNYVPSVGHIYDAVMSHPQTCVDFKEVKFHRFFPYGGDFPHILKAIFMKKKIYVSGDSSLHGITYDGDHNSYSDKGTSKC